MKSVVRNYEWPEGLFELREWLRKQGVDVDAMKSERQALYLAKTLGRLSSKMPARNKPLFPELQKVQHVLCTKRRKTAKQVRNLREPYVPGTFGAASEVRHIDPAEYARATRQGEAA